MKYLEKKKILKTANMNNIKIKIEDINPSNNITPQILYDQFNWRKNHTYAGDSTITIINPLEPIWWNRPLSPDIMLKKESDGLYSYNLPYIHNYNLYKTNYNILVGRGTVALVLLVKIDNSWTQEQKLYLTRLAKTAVYNTILKFGADKNKLSKPSNDLLYDGKKFMGYECAEYNSWFGAAAVITLNYSNEKEIFQRLTGRYALLRPICGIQEELDNSFTKEQFIEALNEEFKILIKAL